MSYRFITMPESQYVWNLLDCVRGWLGCGLQGTGDWTGFPMPSHALALWREWTDQHSLCLCLSFAGCLPHTQFCLFFSVPLMTFSFVLLSTLVFSAASDG